MAASSDNAPANIIASDVQVRYTVATKDPSHRSTGVQKLTNTVLGRQGRTTVRALRGVSLIAREGEMIGVVGANGSGKSTFLRNIAGVEQPDRGRILVRYQPLLLGVSAALQPSLSGSENVRLGCLAMGLTPDEAAEAYDRVVDLSALGSAIHRPMGTYSSGMGSRLRFAIALAARPKILLIDEALSTGDATFAERSERAMDDLLAEAGTMLLVNHAAKVIQELCTRAVWMHKGQILMDGPAEAVAEKYRWWAWNVAKDKGDVADKLLDDVVRSAHSDAINILEPELIDDPFPRHARRLVGKRKRTKHDAPRHAERHRPAAPVEETAEPSLTASVPQAWPERIDADSLPAATFPVLPKPASQAVGAAAPRVDGPPPLRVRSGRQQVVLRAANPDDRASAVAEDDLLGRRLAADARRVSAERYRVRQQMRGELVTGPDEPEDDGQSLDQLVFGEEPRR